ncbi:phosphomannomutase/phosphoglucomutase [Marinobacteraceae bacterium S3BR75-40.1]
MKLGKKKEEAAEKPQTQAESKKGNAKGGKAANQVAGLKLNNIQWSQAAIVIAVGVLIAAALQFLVAQPAEREAGERLEASHADAARLHFEQRLQMLSGMVERYATLPATAESLAGNIDVQERTRVLEGLLPSVRRVFLFPSGRVNQPSGGDFELSFASMDLARRAEQREETHPDAFLHDGEWLFQMASPVVAPDSEQVVGSLLVIFDVNAFQSALQLPSGVQGQLNLVQSVGGQSKSILSVGKGRGDSLSENLSVPNWTLTFKPAMAAPQVVSRSMLWGLPVVLGVVGAVLVVMLFTQVQKALRADLMGLTQWAHKAFGGEKVRTPTQRIAMLGALAETLQRLALAVDKRISKAETAAREATKKQSARPAAPAQAETAETASGGEPLFQEKDMLDIDMLDGDEDVLGLGGDSEGMEIGEAQSVDVDVPAGIFRAYDIRGVVGESLSADIVRVIGQAIGSEASSKGVDKICVGYDGRDSSPELADALSLGIMRAGVDVVDVGRVPTPLLYFATHQLQTGSGVMVTGSHNPPEYNGLKMMLAGETLAGDAIQQLLRRVEQSNLTQGQGSLSRADIREDYLQTILNDIAVAAPLKVVLDAGNGIAGELAPRLVEELGCEVIPLYCDVDGSFPNHHPDPGKPENLAPLIDKVKAEGADLGIAFDGDGDRLGVVTNSGKIIWPDRLLMLFARDVVSRNPGADIIYDVKCTRRLANVINEFGGRPVMWKTGHSWIKARMKETGALLAGEMSGHIFFSERWYGFDDGLYSAARLLEILGIEDRSVDEVFEEFPEDFSTPELNVPTTDEAKFKIVDKLAHGADFGEANISDIDGVRVDYPDGWGLCRASNTTPVLVLRFEAETEDALERIKGIFREQLQKVDPDLQVDF